MRPNFRIIIKNVFLEFLQLDLIGSGSFGQVYRGLWRGTFVAAKVISIPGVKEKLWENEISIYR